MDEEKKGDFELSPEVRAQAESLVRRFFAQCFWFRHPKATVVTVADAKLAVRHLREYCGKEGWREAAELVKCL